MDVSRYLKSVQDRVANGVTVALREAGYETAEFEQKIVHVAEGGTFIENTKGNVTSATTTPSPTSPSPPRRPEATVADTDDTPRRDGIRVSNTGGNVTIGDHNTVTSTVTGNQPSRDPLQEELLLAIRRLRGDLGASSPPSRRPPWTPNSPTRRTRSRAPDARAPAASPDCAGPSRTPGP